MARKEDAASLSRISKGKPKVAHTVEQSLGDEVLMRPPFDSEEEAPKPDKLKKRKKKADVESLMEKNPKSPRPRATAKVSASASGASPSTGDEDDNDDEYSLDSRVTNVGGPHEGGDVLENFLDGVGEDIDLYAPNAIEEAERLQQQAKKIYDHAISKLRYELIYHKKEAEDLTSGLKELETSSARKEEEMSGLEAARSVRQKNALVEQLREEAVTKDAEALNLRGQNGDSANEEVAAVSSAKSVVEEKASSYKNDATTANEKAREILVKAKQKLTRAIAYARAQARRQALEEVSDKGADLSAEIEEARTLEEISTLSATSDDGSDDDSEGSGGEE
ncbi:uncharacterized protein [Nicotiana sylvestris]|uniref:uncharacterized protein n=1 Tax=Nicotiana sylvestris TaxID=4096 RepID=UPI00388CCBFE